MNIQEMTNWATDLARTGQFVELESVCKKILKKKPKNFSALHLLACAQNGIGQIEIEKSDRKWSVNLDHRKLRRYGLDKSFDDEERFTIQLDLYLSHK